MYFEFHNVFQNSIRSGWQHKKEPFSALAVTFQTSIWFWQRFSNKCQLRLLWAGAALSSSRHAWMELSNAVAVAVAAAAAAVKAVVVACINWSRNSISEHRLTLTCLIRQAFILTNRCPAVCFARRVDSQELIASRKRFNAHIFSSGTIRCAFRFACQSSVKKRLGSEH